MDSQMKYTNVVKLTYSEKCHASRFDLRGLRLSVSGVRYYKTWLKYMFYEEPVESDFC